MQLIAKTLPPDGFVRIEQILGPPGPIPISRSLWWRGLRSGKYPKPNKFFGNGTTASDVRDKPVIQVNTKAWRAALVRAGIENFRWHDLRHTWANWLTQKGVPLNVIQQMGAWESPEMVRRYAHLAPEQFASHARVVDAVLNFVKFQIQND